MKLKALTAMLAVIALAACAAQPAAESSKDDPNLRLTKDAARVVEEKGEVEAAKAGTKEAKKSDLVCESVKRTGSHMTETYCYSRAEAERDREKVIRELGPGNRGNVQPDVGER